METITIKIDQSEVYEEVAKATDYTWSKLEGASGELRDRILAADADLAEMGRFWDEGLTAIKEALKEMVAGGQMRQSVYELELEVSNSYNQGLNGAVAGAMRSFMVMWMVGQWFRYSNKGEAGQYIEEARGYLLGAERMLYSRKKPRKPSV